MSTDQKSKKPRLPTLNSIVGTRPKCHCCHNVLSAKTWKVDVIGHVTTMPTVEELCQLGKTGLWDAKWAIDHGYQPERVFRLRYGQLTYTLTSSEHKSSAPSTRLWFWSGRFAGYGYIDKPNLFCNVQCAALFGLAAWVSGVRMKSYP